MLFLCVIRTKEYEIFEKINFYWSPCAHTKDKDKNLVLYFTNFVFFSLSHNVSETLIVINYILYFSNGLSQI